MEKPKWCNETELEYILANRPDVAKKVAIINIGYDARMAMSNVKLDIYVEFHDVFNVYKQHKNIPQSRTFMQHLTFRSNILYFTKVPHRKQRCAT